MRKLAIALLASTMVLFTGLSPASAITYGQPDNGEHPYVGFMIFYVPADEGWFSCSGTLLDEDTFLTAGHCTYDIGFGGEDGEPTGGTDVWVSFDETDVLAGWPARADYDTGEELYDARSAWLNDPANGFVSGTAIPHPDYDNFSGFPQNFDVGVVELDEDVVMSTYGVLAAVGTAEELAGEPKNRNNALVENVGYGIQSIQPNPMDETSRYKSTSRIVQVNSSISGAGNLHTLNNPSAVGGTGGTCFGDSGGPVLVNNTNEVIAVVSFGFSGTCHGADYSWRVDTADSYEFLAPFLGG
jgi:hypothetical protein